MRLKLQTVLLFFVAIVFTTNAQVSDKETAARSWINEHNKEINIQPYHTLKLGFVRKTQSGETLRFYQYLNDIQVVDAEILVHFSPSNEITSTAITYNSAITNISTISSITKEDAIAISDANLKIEGGFNFQEAKLFVAFISNQTKLVYKVTTNPNSGSASWESFIDAQTGNLISVKDVAIYEHSKKVKKNQKENTKRIERNNAKQPLAFVTGTAMIYLSDPLSYAQVAYGAPGYVDGNDANTAQLAAARTAVTLPEISLTTGVYKLKSSFAEIVDIEAPTTGLYTQATSAFNFTRDNNAFEAVNVFYHIDKSMRYINQTLGIPCVAQLNAGVVKFDPSGLSGADNSHYLPSTDQLAFGEGCVDDAEDADVIWHELGHGIHDWITNGSTASQIGEGNGDYWAVSYSRSLNQWQPTDDAYQFVFSWDGQNTCWNGRRTDTTKLYPGGLVNQVHADGEIWVAALMQIWDVLGREKTDKMFLNGLDLTTSSMNQQSAAIALRTAAIDMNYSCDDITTITEKFTDRGYVLPTLPLSMAIMANQTVAADATNTYTLPSYATLANPISAACAATLAQSPVEGTILAPGVYTITMTATLGTSVVVRTFTLTVTQFLHNDNFVKESIVIYPNPAKNQITIKGEFDATESITIFNMLGQKITEKASISNEEKVDVSKLSNGVYTIYFNTSKASYKFIKE